MADLPMRAFGCAGAVVSAVTLGRFSVENPTDGPLLVIFTALALVGGIALVFSPEIRQRLHANRTRKEVAN